MREFMTAVKEDFVPEGEEDALVFLHDGREVKFYEPSSGQLAIMSTIRASKDPGQKEARAVMSFFFGMMDEATADYFEERLMDRNDPFDLDSEGGITEIFEYLLEEWSGKASKQPSDYQQSPKQTGRSSTGNTRAKASTSSNSRSRASSTSSKRGS